MFKNERRKERWAMMPNCCHKKCRPTAVDSTTCGTHAGMPDGKRAILTDAHFVNSHQKGIWDNQFKNHEGLTPE